MENKEDPDIEAVDCIEVAGIEIYVANEHLMLWNVKGGEGKTTNFIDAELKILKSSESDPVEYVEVAVIEVEEGEEDAVIEVDVSSESQEDGRSIEAEI